MAIATGPSIRAVCRILNQNSCGSGSVVGVRNGKSLIMTNAHVAGSRVGRIVRVEHEQTGDKFNARVIMAAYSDRTTSDWAVLESVNDWAKVTPVKMSKKIPTGSHYTKGFPRCRPHNGTDITTQNFRPPVWFWEPDAIGGQSGSGVWSDTDGHQYGLLTWQWGSHGAGQMTSEIYKQQRNRTNAGYPLPPGVVPLEDDYDFTGLDRTGLTDPELENGFFTQTGIQDLPIWAEDDVEPPPTDPTDPPSNNAWREYAIEEHRRASEYHDDERKRLEGDMPSTNGEAPVTPGPTFNL